LHNLIRGLSPIPLAFTHTPDGKLLKVVSSRVVSADGEHENAGEIVALDGEITLLCGRGALALCSVLPEGKGRMSAADFIRGRRVNVGDVLK
jgi:methionyl-tRNA formyltransferase